MRGRGALYIMQLSWVPEAVVFKLSCSTSLSYETWDWGTLIIERRLAGGGRVQLDPTRPGRSHARLLQVMRSLYVQALNPAHHAILPENIVEEAN